MEKLTKKQAKKAAQIWASCLVFSAEWCDEDQEAGELVMKEMINLSMKISRDPGFSHLSDILEYVRANY